MAQENVLDKIRRNLQSANQGSPMSASAPAPSNGFSIRDGMLNSPESAPKQLGSSYVSV